MDTTISDYRKLCLDLVNKRIPLEEFWKRLKDLDAKQPGLFKEKEEVVHGKI